MVDRVKSFNGEWRGTPFSCDCEYDVDAGRGHNGLRGKTLKPSPDVARAYNRTHKKTDLIFLRYALNDSSAAVFAYDTKNDPVPPGVRVFHPEKLCGMVYNGKRFIRDFDLEVALTGSPLFNVPIADQTTLRQIFKIPYDEIRTCSVSDPSLVKGHANLQFYMQGRQDPEAFFSGTFFNGVPSGYGMFLAPYTENGKAVHPNLQYARREPVFFIRAGMWHEGQLRGESVLQRWVESAALMVLQDKLGYSSDIAPTTVSMVEAYCLQDSITRSNINQVEVVAKMTWKDPIDTKGERWAWFRLETLDFFDMAPKLVILQMDPSSQRTVDEARKSEDANFHSGGFISFERTYLYDDYTEIREGAEYQRHFNFYCPYGYEPDYGVNCTDIQIRVRPTRSAAFKLVDTYMLVDLWRSCDEARSANESWFGGIGRVPNYHVLDSNSQDLVPFAQGYSTAIHKLVQQVKIAHPDPVNDTTQAPYSDGVEEKIKAVLDRLRNSPRLAFNEKDTLAGIWWYGGTEEMPDELLYVPSASASTWYRLITDNIKLDKNYQNAFMPVRQRGKGYEVLSADGILSPIRKVQQNELIVGDYTYGNKSFIYRRLVPLGMKNQD